MAYESLCKALAGLAAAKAADPIETIVVKGVSLDGFWDENKHPRSHGRFAKKDGEKESESVRDDMGKGDHPEFQRVTDDDRLALHNALQKANGELNEATENLDSRENQVLGHRDAVYRLGRARAKVDHLTAMHRKLQELDAEGTVPRRYHLDWEHEGKSGSFGDWIAGKRGMWEGGKIGRQPTHTLHGQEFKTHSAKNAGISAARREFNAQLAGIESRPAKTPSDAPRTPPAPSSATKDNLVLGKRKDGSWKPLRELHTQSVRENQWNRNAMKVGGHAAYVPARRRTGMYWLPGDDSRVNVAALPKPNLPK